MLCRGPGDSSPSTKLKVSDALLSTESVNLSASKYGLRSPLPATNPVDDNSLSATLVVFNGWRVVVASRRGVSAQNSRDDVRAEFL